MNGHREIQLLLYEFNEGTLSGPEHQKVLSHLRSCAECSVELEAMRSVLSVVARPTTQPSEDQSTEFWQGFARVVENRIREERTPRRNVGNVLTGVLDRMIVRVWRPVAASTIVLTLALLAFFFAQRGQNPEKTDVAAVPEVIAPVAPPENGGQVSRYLRRSNALLIGLTNREIGDEEKIDLSAERELSRQLVREARSLQEQPLDAQSSQMVRNLERVLLEVANKNDLSTRSDFEMIRGGIRRENLLFKVRMAEQLHGSRGSLGGIRHAKHR